MENHVGLAKKLVLWTMTATKKVMDIEVLDFAALEHRVEGNNTERSEQVFPWREYAGREAQGGREFHFWEHAVCLCAGSGMLKALVVFALGTQSMFLSPSIPSSQGCKAFTFSCMYSF